MTAGGVFSAGCGRAVDRASTMPRRRVDLGRPVVGADRRGADHPAVDVVEQRLAHLVAAQVEHVVRRRPRSPGRRAPSTAAGPCARRRPWSSARCRSCGSRRTGRPCGPGRACRGRSRAASPLEQLRVLAGDAVALGDELVHGTVDVGAVLQPLDVALDERERRLGHVAPVLVVGVEAVAGREVEPGVLGVGPRRRPLRTGGVGGDRGEEGRGIRRVGEVGDQAVAHGDLGQLLQLVVGTEQLHVDALHHRGDRLVGDAREDLLAEHEEVEVGDVAEVQELEVVLPRAVGEGDQPVVVGEQLGRGAGALAAQHVVERDRVGQRGELERLELVDRRLELGVPVRQQALPVLEVVAGALHELRERAPRCRRGSTATGDMKTYPLWMRYSMPFAVGMSSWRELYWPRQPTANSNPIVSNGFVTVGQCWLSQNQNFASSTSRRFSWKTRL